MNIGTEYSALVSAIQKDWKNENTILAKAALQIIRHFEFMERNKKVKTVQTSTLSVNLGPKKSCTNPECMEKNLTTYYSDCCWIRNPKLKAKYAFAGLRKIFMEALQRKTLLPKWNQLPKKTVEN